MPLISLKCPQCGADLKIDDNRDSMFCEFCGAKVIREQNNSGHDANWYYNSITELIKKGDMSLARKLNEKYSVEHPLDDRWRELGGFLAADKRIRSLANAYKPYYSDYVDWEDKKCALNDAEEMTAARKDMDKYSRLIPDMAVYDDLYNDYMSKNRAYLNHLRQKEEETRIRDESWRWERQQKEHEEEREKNRAKTVKTVLIWSLIVFIVISLWLLGSGY